MEKSILKTCLLLCAFPLGSRAAGIDFYFTTPACSCGVMMGDPVNGPYFNPGSSHVVIGYDVPNFQIDVTGGGCFGRLPANHSQFTSGGTINLCVAEMNTYTYTNYWKNLDSIGHNVQVTSNGVFVFQQYLKPGDSVAVGGSGSTSQHWAIIVLNTDNGLINSLPSTYTTNNPPGTPGNPSYFPPPTSVYSGGSNSIPGATIGDQALYDAIAKLGQQLHQDIVFSNSATTFNGSTNRDGLSTNMSSGNIPSFGTNATAATSAGSGQLGTTASDMNSLGTGMGSGPGSLGSGSSSLLTVNMMGITLHLDPEDHWPGLMGWIKLINTMVLLVWFAEKAGRLLWEASQTYAQAETGGVPDLEASVSILGCSVSANVAGLIVAAAVPVAFIVLWKIVIDYFLGGSIQTYLGQVASAVDGFNMNGVAAALYLLDAMFPISLYFSLLTTYLGMHFLAAKLVVVAASASRFLFGK